jgi:hypothetical protein
VNDVDEVVLVVDSKQGIQIAGDAESSTRTSMTFRTLLAAYSVTLLLIAGVLVLLTRGVLVTVLSYRTGFRPDDK